MTIKDTKYVRGAEKLAQRIKTIRAVTGLPALKNEIGELLLRRTLERFDKAVDPDGKKWKTLSPETRRQKRRLGVGGILKRTKALREAIQIIRGDVTGTIFTNTGAGIRIGVKDPKIAEYGGYHNRGAKNLPQRRFLGISAADVKAVDGLLRRTADKVENS